MGCFVVGGGYRLLGLLTKRRTLWYCQHVWSSCTIYLFNDDVGAVTFILLLIILILTCPHPPAAIYYIKHILAHKEKLNTVYSVELLGSMDQWFWDSGFVLCLYLRSQSYADSCKGSFSMDALPSRIEACVFSVCSFRYLCSTLSTWLLLCCRILCLWIVLSLNICSLALFNVRGIIEWLFRLRRTFY